MRPHRVIVPGNRLEDHYMQVNKEQRARGLQRRHEPSHLSIESKRGRTMRKRRKGGMKANRKHIQQLMAFGTGTGAGEDVSESTGFLMSQSLGGFLSGLVGSFRETSGLSPPTKAAEILYDLLEPIPVVGKQDENEDSSSNNNNNIFVTRPQEFNGHKRPLANYAGFEDGNFIFEQDEAPDAFNFDSADHF